ncbi:protein phosphatase 2C domain-containing protein [Toxoplasma gondii GT1]|uniref:Protein phosphatase 2C domain-containing protein n=2 Tax=Toxoplasma gondii TaxID=5811 RepID=S7UNL6_TOXGG|nr:protein phosphatase 2C domain-containing protein [Toxoplasma gondii GT1]KAF4645490.1 protein phosphatase 2C domain-containing protein [Toxoplasma gondii]
MHRTLSAIHSVLSGRRVSSGGTDFKGDSEEHAESFRMRTVQTPRNAALLRPPLLFSDGPIPSACLPSRSPFRHSFPLRPPPCASCQSLVDASPFFTNPPAPHLFKPPSESNLISSSPSTSLSSSSPQLAFCGASHSASGGETRGRTALSDVPEEAEGERRDTSLSLRQFRRRGKLASPVGQWLVSFNVFPATATRHAFVAFSPEGLVFADGFQGPGAASFVSRRFFSLLDESSAAGASSACVCGTSGRSQTPAPEGEKADAKGSCCRQKSEKSATPASDFPTLNSLLRNKEHSALIAGLDRHFASLDRAFFDACSREASRVTQGSSVCAAFFGGPLGVLVCTLGDVGAVLVVREGERARRRKSERRREKEKTEKKEKKEKEEEKKEKKEKEEEKKEKKEKEEEKKEKKEKEEEKKVRREPRAIEWTPTQGNTEKESSPDDQHKDAETCLSSSCSLSRPSSSVSSPSISPSSPSRSSSSSKEEVSLPLVAWRLADPHNAENVSEMTRLRRAHPHAKPQSLLQGHLLKGVSPATRAIGAFHLKDPELNAELPAGRRVANYGSKEPPLVSSRPDYTLQPFHPDVEGLIVGSAGFWQLLSPEEAASLLDIFITSQHASAAAQARGDVSAVASASADDDAATFLLRAALVELFCRRERTLRTQNLSHRAMEAAGLPHWSNVKQMVLEKQATLGDVTSQLQMIHRLEDLHAKRPDEARLDSLSLDRVGLVNSDVAVCVVLRDCGGPSPKA